MGASGKWALFFVSFQSFCGLLSHAKPSSPNIVFIMADDLGWGEVQIYPGGASKDGYPLLTPNLDKFGREGIMFTEAYAGYTVCAPSRTTLMTGRHSGNFRRYGLPGTSLEPGQAVTVAEILKNKGNYITAAFGKSAPLTKPLQSGFDHFIGQVDQSLCHNMYPRYIDFGNETGNVNLTKNWKVPGSAPEARAACMKNPDKFSYTVDITSQQSIAWIKLQAKRQRAEAMEESEKMSRPFFLYQAFTIPHAGGWGHAPNKPEEGAPVPSDGEYASRSEWPEVERDHAAVVSYLDARVGELMETLKSEGVDNSTIVFFASDNGAHLEGGHDVHFFNSTGGLRGHKRSMFEGGVRSPSMVRWPGHILPEGVSDYQWAFWDIMPTFAEIAGLDVDKDLPSGIDGQSFLHVLLAKETSMPSSENRLIYFTGQSAWGRNHYDASNGSVRQSVPLTAYSVRWGKWKMVVSECKRGSPSMADAAQIYDLSTDKFEMNDIAGTEQGKVQAQMMKKIVIQKNLSCECYQC